MKYHKYSIEALSLNRVATDTTAGGKSLETLGVTLNPRAVRISLQAVGGNIYVSDVGGVPDANSFVLLANGSITLDVSLLMAKTLKFLAAGADTTLNVLQLGEV